MLYRVIKNMIALGNVAGLEEKLDVFLAAGKLTMDEYTQLLAQMREQAGER